MKTTKYRKMRWKTDAKNNDTQNRKKLQNTENCWGSLILKTTKQKKKKKPNQVKTTNQRKLR